MPDTGDKHLITHLPDLGHGLGQSKVYTIAACRRIVQNRAKPSVCGAASVFSRWIEWSACLGRSQATAS
jgi:hypothetical protein